MRGLRLNPEDALILWAAVAVGIAIWLVAGRLGAEPSVGSGVARSRAPAHVTQPDRGAGTSHAATATATGGASAPVAGSVAAVTVRVDAAAQPTFLCVEDEQGRTLFAGMLAGSKTFKSGRLRMNIGLSSTLVTVGGKTVPLAGSPTGLELTKANGAQPLAPQLRPCG
ncbi:MAG TPA: hypothetical protein VFB41_09080 [Solirubrobacteraceae bacterium]|nr:hypothetical protein [Solirubrobacteraceae bacterium]